MALRKTDYPDGFVSNATPAVVSVVGIKVEIFEIVSTDLINGYVALSGTPEQVSTVSLTWNGIDQYQGASRDFTVNLNQVVFSSNLLNNMDVGDLLQISYQ